MSIKKFLFLCFCLFLSWNCAFGNCALVAKTRVLVSIAPYLEIVQKIGGENVEVELIVPQGADSHNYEPTPGQINEAAVAKVWFCIGEHFENKLGHALKSVNSK